MLLKRGPFFRHEEFPRVRVFQRKEFRFPVDPARISGQASARPDDAVAGDDQRDRVVPDGAADRLRRHTGKPFLRGELSRDIAVGSRPSERNRHQDSPDVFPEFSRRQDERWRKIRGAAAEIKIEPPIRLIEDREAFFFMGFRESSAEIFLTVEP